jgi:hypothetical protein
MVFMNVFGLFARYTIVEPSSPTYYQTNLAIILTTACIVFFRLRFFYALVGGFTIIAAQFLIRFLTGSNTYGDHWLDSSKSILFCILTETASWVFNTFACYYFETFLRHQFLSGRVLKSHNDKLVNQLNRLQKDFGDKAADFDSPLEKSVLILKSMMADPSIKTGHILELTQVINLLSSSNLMTPDLENQTHGMDADQEVSF